MNIGERIRAERERQKVSRKDLAQYAGIGVSTLSDLELGRSQNTTALHKIAARLAVSVDFLETGREPRQAKPQGDQSIPTTETNGDYVLVSQMGEAGMGGAKINDDYPEVVRSVDFSQAYIRSVIGYVPPPGRLKLVTGVGDSMAPKIKPGESVLVDTGCNEFVGNGLYLINDGYGHQIKALQAEPDGIWARSSDPVLYPPFKLTPDSIVGGRVYLIQHLERVA